MEKLPIMLTIGDKEVEEKTVSVRSRREGPRLNVSDRAS